jgi:penicillin-binding protein 1A
VALADKGSVPFRVPAGIKLIRVNPRNGMRAGPGEGSILEAFKPGTAPPDGYSVIGVTDAEGRPVAPQQQQPAEPPRGAPGGFGNLFRGLY